MANKVLSIKMDEKDIEKLKKYYAALTGAGFLSSETMWECPKVCVNLQTDVR